MHRGPLSLNVDYSIKKISKELDSIESRLQKLETGQQPRDWNLYKIIWKFENFSIVSNNPKLFEETKNKNDTDPNLARDFCGTAFLSKPMVIVSLSAPSLMDVAQPLANRCLSLYLW